MRFGILFCALATTLSAQEPLLRGVSFGPFRDGEAPAAQEDAAAGRGRRRSMRSACVVGRARIRVWPRRVADDVILRLHSGPATRR